MKYYRVDIKNYKIGISCGYETPTKEYLNSQVHEFLKSQKVNINRNETFEFQDSNEKEFNELKREFVLNPDIRFNISIQMLC